MTTGVRSPSERKRQASSKEPVMNATSSFSIERAGHGHRTMPVGVALERGDAGLDRGPMRRRICSEVRA